MSITDWNGGATARVVKGRGIASRRADKRQLAALAASILEGDLGFRPSARQLAQMFGVNATYIHVARHLSPAKRQAIAAGEDQASFTALLNPPERLALPAPGSSISDGELTDIARRVGPDRMLEAAVAVEQHAHP
jgi:hypothetical protein